MKRLLIGIIIGMLIMPVAALATTSEVTARFMNFNIVVNGEQRQLTNQPLVHNGVSYLPVREMANLLGYSVDFRDGTIYLSDGTGAAATSNSGNVGVVNSLIVDGLTIIEMVSRNLEPHQTLALNFERLNIMPDDITIYLTVVNRANSITASTFNVQPLIDAGILFLATE